ncbi:MAG TPA: hypothetical protein VGI18_08940 [Burkholderiales bacterium]
MLKKTILATLTGAAVLASSASFADPYYRGHRPVVVERVYHPAPRPVFVREYYRPRPVVVQRPVYVQAAPVYHADGLAILAGAIIGGAVAYNIAH